MHITEILKKKKKQQQGFLSKTNIFFIYTYPLSLLVSEILNVTDGHRIIMCCGMMCFCARAAFQNQLAAPVLQRVQTTDLVQRG